jgi:ABC transporter with metal-binding/Fe-S-binding domain ATP-binding protein
VRVAVLYTGGKDSHYALMRALEAGLEVACLITAVPGRPDSYMFHSINVRWSALHGEAVGMPHHFVEVSGVKEAEVEELAEALRGIKRGRGIEGLVSGAVASRYQKSRVDAVAERLGLKHVAPLWGRDPERLLREEASAMRFMVVAVMALGLGPSHLGRVVTPEVAEEIIALSRRYGFSPVGEGGEYESFVVESPLVSVEVLEGEAHWHPSGWGYYMIRRARARPKTALEPVSERAGRQPEARGRCKAQCAGHWEAGDKA